MNFTLLLQGFCAKLFTKYTYLLPFPFYVDELLLFTYAGIVVGLFSLFVHECISSFVVIPVINTAVVLLRNSWLT